jgi:hypothetical protein
MGRKKDFNQIPDDFSKLKPGDQLSSYKAEKLIPIPGSLCSDPDVPDVIHLAYDDTDSERGRIRGTNVLYSPNQIYNYKSQSERYDRSIYNASSYQKETDNSTIYGFCSHQSPTGFWEVTVSKIGKATYINFAPNFLTILCPRPFNVSELTTLTSDTNTYKWTQISGSRTILITPDNVQDPIIDIQTTCYTGACDPGSIEPLVLRVETDNPLVFTDLIIINRPIDNFDGLGYASWETGVTCRKVNTINIVPVYTQKAYVWAGENLLITWNDPSCDASFLQDYRLQKLIGSYTDILSFTPIQNRIASIEANQRYRIAADFAFYGSATDTSYSEPIFVDYDALLPLKTVFADDSARCLGYALISDSSTAVEFGNQVRNASESDNLGLGYAFISDSSTTVEFGAQVRIVSESDNLSLGYAFIGDSSVTVDLGGIIVG